MLKRFKKSKRPGNVTVSVMNHDLNSQTLDIAHHAQTEALDTGVATRNDINELRRDMLEMELRLIKWGVGLALGQAALVTTLVKLL